MAIYFAIAAEIECDLISQRKKSGIILGCPCCVGKSKLDLYRPELAALLANGSAQTFIVKRYHITLPSLSRWIKKYRLDDTAITDISVR